MKKIATHRTVLSYGCKFRSREFDKAILGLIAGTWIGLGMMPLGNTAWATNIAPQGTGIMGVNDAVDSDAGRPRAQAGVVANINDQDEGTRVDNWFGNDGTDQGQAISFVGITWPTARFEQIQSLTLTLATFLDGGWFGTKGIDPGAGGSLTSEHLKEPTLQVSTNAGVTWTTVPHTSDYLTVMNGHGIGGGANANPSLVIATFTPTAPISEINGIRIIGENGGTADGNGFIGVFELAVEATLANDSDSDGMPDTWERANGLNVGANDASGDPDSDDLTNLDEFTASTNPKQADSDNDGLNDGEEVKTARTNPLLADTDKDGLNDGPEVKTHRSDPLLADTDGDGLSDSQEVNTTLTDPVQADSDGDGFSDGLEVAQGSDPKNPSSIPSNFALFGAAILGIKESLESGPETEQPYEHVGTVDNINDGISTTRIDTWNESGTSTVSYVGILWDQIVTNPIVNLKLTLATFLDGGWFGPNNRGPGAGGRLTTNHLSEPSVQISRDGGSTWTTVAHTSDYLTALLGHGIGGGANPNPSSVAATFTLNEPAAGINGIRIIGTEGGTASGGFIGVFELEVTPSSTDSDHDGLDDRWERQNGLQVGVNDAAADPDEDGLSNKDEQTAETNPKAADTDGDGLHDGAEVNTHHSNPLRADTDGDGLSDGVEVNQHQTNPLATDTDSDGFPDGMEIARGTNPKDKASYPDNVAPLGTGIMGTKESMESGPESEVPVFNAGTAIAINDDNLTTRVDTYNGGNVGTVSFVGVIWDQPVTNPIIRLEFTLATFFDGGWFGVNNLGPGSGGRLSASEHLVEPSVQVSTNKGASWTTVASTSDYLTALDNHPLPAVDFGEPTIPTATFTLVQPQTGLTGIRLIGSEGGTASGGFLGAFDLAVRISGKPSVQGVRLINPRMASGQFHFDFISKAGATHIVLYKNALTDTNWQTLTTIIGDGAQKEVTDSLHQIPRIYIVTTQ